MIAHVVLFRPKGDLTEDQRTAFVGALERALADIPTIARAHIGRRMTLGREYDAHNAQEFPYVAILEFESEDALRAYLEHPVHQTLGQQFYLTAESALAFDFELLERTQLRRLLD